MVRVRDHGSKDEVWKQDCPRHELVLGRLTSPVFEDHAPLWPDESDVISYPYRVTFEVIASQPQVSLSGTALGPNVIKALKAAGSWGIVIEDQEGDVFDELDTTSSRPRTTPKHYWLFQANPKYWDLAEALTTWSLGEEDTWVTTNYHKEIEKGDEVVLRSAGPDARAYALAEVTGPSILLGEKAEFLPQGRTSNASSGGRPSDSPGVLQPFDLPALISLTIPSSAISASFGSQTLRTSRSLGRNGWRCSH